MKLTLRIGAAVGIVALSACGQSGTENSSNPDSAAEAAAPETGNVPEENGPTDTLGNQLDQLNDSDASETNTANGD